MWKDRSVLVTGAAGFIGSNLCDALVARGARVTALDDLSAGKRSHLAEAEASGRLQFVEGSILDRPLLERLLPEAEVVYHLAVACLRECFERPQYVHEINATGTLILLEAARVHSPRLQRFVYVSSSEVYGSAQQAPMDESHPLLPTTTYGGSKLAGEVYAQTYHTMYAMPVSLVRPFNTYGPREHHEGASGEVIPRFAVRIANGLPPLIFGDGRQTRDFTYVADTAEGLVRAVETPETVGRVVNLARGEEVSVARIAELLLARSGRSDLQVERRPARPADVERHFADVSRMQAWTGYRPPTSIETGIERYMEWFRRAHPNPAALLEEVQDQNW